MNVWMYAYLFSYCWRITLGLGCSTMILPTCTCNFLTCTCIYQCLLSALDQLSDFLTLLQSCYGSMLAKSPENSDWFIHPDVTHLCSNSRTVCVPPTSTWLGRFLIKLIVSTTLNSNNIHIVTFWTRTNIFTVSRKPVVNAEFKVV